MKRKIYFNEYNLLMGDSTYLPLVSGILHAYANLSEVVRLHYEFADYIFHIDDPQNIIAAYDNPSVAAFSVSMWNEQLSLKVAREVKNRYPECLIIFGGAQVPHDSLNYLNENTFIDVTVRGEGEDSFRDILEAMINGKSLSNIPGVTARARDGVINVCREERVGVKDLDVFPSPYLEGLYDQLMENNPEFNFQAIIETNRGCPFKCTFCYWGMGGLRRKYRFHSVARVKDEIEWFAKREIAYVFNADSNFGMHRRDEEIAKILIDTKKRYGFPEKFRTCYGKNTDQRIFKIGSELHAHQLEKGITISYQSIDPQVQINIKRANIKLTVAEELQRKFNELNVPVYTEMILGLPGESVQSWKKGIDRVLNSGLKNQLFLYICEVLPNTDLADSAYQQLYGIKSTSIELTEIHVSPRKGGWIREIEEIIVETNSMSRPDWQRALCFSWATMLFHSLKVAYFILAFLRKEYAVKYSEIISILSEGDFEAKKFPLLSRYHQEMIGKTERILHGEGRGMIAIEYGNIYWEKEETMFFDIAENVKQFYDELNLLVTEYLSLKAIKVDRKLLKMVFDYQSMCIPSVNGFDRLEYKFSYNLPEYFEKLYTSKEIVLSKQDQAVSVDSERFNGDKPRYARETILWKRKNGTFLNKLEWRYCDQLEVV